MTTTKRSRGPLLRKQLGYWSRSDLASELQIATSTVGDWIEAKIIPAPTRVWIHAKKRRYYSTDDVAKIKQHIEKH